MNQQYVLFLDDLRDPPEELKKSALIARSYEDAVNLVTWCGTPMFIMFDHDLGTGKNGLDFAKWFGQSVLDKKVPFDLNNFDYFVHSENPVGKKNIEGYMDDFINHFMDMKEFD